MKMSLAWIYGHIVTDYTTVDVPELVRLFTLKTAEVESCTPYRIDWSAFSTARVTRITTDAQVTVFSAEWDTQYTLPFRSDVQVDRCVLITKTGYALLSYFGHAKDDLFPVVSVSEDQMRGAWKKQLSTTDYIIEIDNKSINHRPDLWSARGMAREIAALYNLPLVPLALARTQVICEPGERIAHAQLPFSIHRTTPACSRFAVSYIPEIAVLPSSVITALYLVRVGGKPINNVVDATNYVLFDLGQPLHAFDAQRIDSKAVTVSYARPGSQLLLLDGTSVNLDAQDVVVSGTEPLSLAGIMGGVATAVTGNTRAVLLEAATFDATTIRKTAMRLKKRTESSTRFEKSLDSEQLVPAIQRFLHMLGLQNLVFVSGASRTPPHIMVAHQDIERTLGVSIAQAYVQDILERLGFGVCVTLDLYDVTVPSWRATKDIHSPEDIIEEIGRMYGYDAITPTALTLPTRVTDVQPVYRDRMLEQHLAYGHGFHQVANYALYDEQWIAKMAYEPARALALQNPLSEHYTRLVTSLIPHLFKNAVLHEYMSQMRFFEIGRTWQLADHVQEYKTGAFLVYDRARTIDFYEGKQIVESLCTLIGCSVLWKKMETPLYPWCLPYESAVLCVEDRIIGYAGTVDPLYIARFDTAHAFIAEWDHDFMRTYRAAQKKFMPLAQYPVSHLDVSALLPLTVSVQELMHIIRTSDTRIISVELIDFFEKKEWKDMRSITCRYVVYDVHKTLEKKDIDAVMGAVHASVRRLGGTIR